MWIRYISIKVVLCKLAIAVCLMYYAYSTYNDEVLRLTFNRLTEMKINEHKLEAHNAEFLRLHAVNIVCFCFGVGSVMMVVSYSILPKIVCMAGMVFWLWVYSGLLLNVEIWVINNKDWFIIMAGFIYLIFADRIKIGAQNEKKRDEGEEKRQESEKGKNSAKNEQRGQKIQKMD